MEANGHMSVIAFVRSKQTGDALQQACSGMDGTSVDVHVATLGDFARDGGRVNGHDVLLLDVDPLDPADHNHLNSILEKECPTMPVVVTSADVGRVDVRKMMGLGVVDVLPQPFRQTDLVIALDHVARQQQVIRLQKQSRSNSGPKGKVITFLKGGGGVGATTLAVQSGCILAEDAPEEKAGACLLDLDIQFGAAGLYLDLINSVGLHNLLESPERLDRSLLSGAMTRHDSGLEVLLNPGEVTPLDSVTPEFVDSCLAVAREMYDHVLIDISPTWTSWSYAALQQSDLIVLVTQLTVAGIRQTLRQLETLQAQDLMDVPLKLALNRYDKGWGLGQSAHLKDAESALHRGFDYFVPNNFRLVSEAINRGVPLSDIENRSKVEKRIREMVADFRTISMNGHSQLEIRSAK